jgi:hypothetical protein
MFPDGQPPPPVIPIGLAGITGAGLIFQFGGAAGWSVILGLISIGVPFLTKGLFNVMPIFGLIAGIRAVTRFRVIGGIVGIALNVIGGLIALLILSVK